MTTTMRLRGPADVLAILPYQLGFHPRDALVVVCLHDGRFGLLQRIDLPPPEQVVEAVSSLLRPLEQADPESVLLIGFEDCDGDARLMLDAMRDACDELDVRVSGRIVVRHGRWWSLDCDDQRCCPRDGVPLTPPDRVPAVAEFVGMEVCPLPDRATLVQRLLPTRPLLLRGVDTAADDLLGQRVNARDRSSRALDRLRAQDLAVWGRLLDPADDAVPVRELAPAELAQMAVSLADVELRDALIAWVCPGSLPLDLLDPPLVAQLAQALPERPSVGAAAQADEERLRSRIEDRLVDLAASLPARWAVGPLTVLASYTWWRGEGALTRIALERALEEDPGYRLALLLLRMVDLGIRPGRVPA